MTAGPLRRCPTCAQALTPEVLERMGLRNGLVLNSLCPGKLGPSDIDNVLHNGRISPERIGFFEYKDGPTGAPTGQRWLLDSLAGEWLEKETGRAISVRTWLLPAHPLDPHETLRGPVGWLFPA